MSFLDDYDPVEVRLEKFWADHPEGRIITEMLPAPEGQYIVKALVQRVAVEGSALPDATGLAQEHVTAKGVNSTSALENCETSAIGRALANLGYAAKGKRPSREEMTKVKAGGEPTRPGYALWLADAVQVFKAWDEDDRHAAYTEAMVFLGYEVLDDQKKAEAVFKNMEHQYSSRPIEQKQLLEGTEK